MGNHRPSSIDDLVRTKLSYTGATVSKVVEVGTPTLDTPARDDVDPMAWLHNPVGLDITPRRNVTWAEAGEIINPCTKIRTQVSA
jgi:hypothetical protein